MGRKWGLRATLSGEGGNQQSHRCRPPRLGSTWSWRPTDQEQSDVEADTDALPLAGETSYTGITVK